MIRNPAPRSATAERLDLPRRHSPEVVRTRGSIGMLAEQVRAEIVQNTRMPQFLVGIVVFPVMLYLMFGLPNAGETLPLGTGVGAFLMASFGAYGILAMVLFSFGVDIANERGRGWLRLMRATPMPAWVYFAAKASTAMLFATVTIAILSGVAALVAGVRLPAPAWAQLFATLLLGGLSFSTIGFALGFWAGPRAASPIANLVYLPLSFASGLFIPLAHLPRVLQEIAPYLPTHHFGQLVWRSVGPAADVAVLAGTPPGGFWVHAAWLAGTFVAFGIVALLGFRRDRRRQFG